MTQQDASNQSPRPLADLPPDELRRYAMELGVELEGNEPIEAVADRVRQRQELLLELDRDALLDVVVWARRPVRKSASREELAGHITRVTQTNYDSLSVRGLAALARLRGLPARADENAEDLVRRLRDHDGLWRRLQRKRRAWLGSILSRVFDKKTKSQQSDYQFLPEGEAAAASERRSLKQEVVDHGLVGGIAQKLRGAADDYIKIKLDEIEDRIDSKLDQIDKRLGEWRDREVANRLRILRLTLMFSVLVALLSLGYNYVKSAMLSPQSEATSRQAP